MNLGIWPLCVDCVIGRSLVTPSAIRCAYDFNSTGWVGRPNLWGSGLGNHFFQEFGKISYPWRGGRVPGGSLGKRFHLSILGVVEGTRTERSDYLSNDTGTGGQAHADKGNMDL